MSGRRKRSQASSSSTDSGEKGSSKSRSSSREGDGEMNKKERKFMPRIPEEGSGASSSSGSGGEIILKKPKKEERDPDLPEVNKRYVVEKETPEKNEMQIATILHMEMRPQKPRVWLDEGEGKSSTPTGGGDEEQMLLMFYVHYEMLDRRNDEWVLLEQIKMHEPIQPYLDILAALPEEMKQQLSNNVTTRSARKAVEDYLHMQKHGNDATTARLEREHEERTKIKNIPRITIGAHTINSWYYSPFPKFCENHEIFMCEYCLQYTPHKSRAKSHLENCKLRQPPGNEIYRKDNLSVYEVDGSGQKLYCQCLCLLSKLFMDHKTLYFDVDDFVFYVLCETDAKGAHVVGYFSREVESQNNLACIMVFPPFQKNGYGKFLIQLSYELSRREGYVGTPEKPLSDLGNVSYRSYWWWVLMKQFRLHCGHTVTGTFLSNTTGIQVPDIVATLSPMRMVKQYKEPEFDPNEHYIRFHRKIYEHLVLHDYGKPPPLILDKKCVRWRPAMTRTEREELQKANATPSGRRASKSQAVTPLPPIDLGTQRDFQNTTSPPTVTRTASRGRPRKHPRPFSNQERGEYGGKLP